MTTQKNKKSIRKNPLFRHRKLASLVLLLLVVLIGTFAYLVYAHHVEQKQIAADRISFDQADEELSMISSQIKSKFNHPQFDNSDQVCSRPYTEVGTNPISCRSEILLRYDVSSSAEATDKYMTIAGIIDSHLTMTELTQSPNMRDKMFAAHSLDQLPQSIYTKGISNISKLPCRGTYTLEENSIYILQFSLSCGKTVKEANYKLIDE